MPREDGIRSRWVDCPRCRQPAVYSAENPARPFCSARCRSLDLGAWASDSYRVVSSEPPEPGEQPSGEDPRH